VIYRHNVASNLALRRKLAESNSLDLKAGKIDGRQVDANDSGADARA
jgi:hypothetical protein